MRRKDFIGAWIVCAASAAWGQSAPALLPVPGAAQQARAREMIRGIYKDQFGKAAAADRQALAKTLLAQGRETRDDSAARYVALSEAADLAAASGDAVTALAAIAEIARSFSVDALDLQRAALVRSHAASSGAQSEAVMRLALDTADQAAAVDAFETVQQLANIAEAAANKTQQVKTVASIQVRLANLRLLVAEFVQVKAAYLRLDKDPADAAAHLVVGRFYALHKGQWPLGLPHLAQGSDAELAGLAGKELAHPEDGVAQTTLGDAWWAYGEKSTGLTHDVALEHARQWYKSAEQSIRGITLARIQSRLAGGAPEKPAEAHVQAAIDLLALIDSAKDGAQGRWSRTPAGITCESSAYACLALPCAPPQEYDLRMRFTRMEGSGPVAMLLCTEKHAFGFALDVKGEARFERVENRVAKDNPTAVPVAISNHHAYTLTVEVRKDHVRALLDGKPLSEWKTDYKDMSRYAPWKLGDNTLCGVGANNAKVSFQGIEMVEVTGKARPTR